MVSFWWNLDRNLKNTMLNEIERIGRLTPEERTAYEEYMASGKPPLSLQTSLQLYELFVQGTGCEDIRRLNTNFSLGMIVRARIEHRWDERRDAHLAELYEQTGTRLRQTVMEGVNFIGDLLSSAHRRYGDRIKKFLQTGDEAELGDLSITSIKQYKEVVEILMKMSGADNKKEITHKGKVEGPQPVVIDVGSKTLTPQVAERLLAVLEKEND
jgi:hypothetical protein